MGKASRTKVESTRREKIAAQRAAEHRAEQRRRILLASGSIVVVLAVVLVFVIVKLNSKPASSSSAQGLSNGPTGSALTTVVNKTTSVPPSTLDAVGDGGGAVTGKPTTISGTTLTENGKPEMLYMGAEYCPYCAAERWAMIVALSRFGTFKGLATVHSAVRNGAGTAEPDPDTPTWTFLHATYSSPYLAFTPLEIQTNIPDPSSGTYTLLQKPTAAEQALITKYDGSTGPIPFIDFGNHYMISGVSYDPGVLDGLSWSTIATDLSNPNSAVAKAADGTANYITAAICKMTGNQPASACTSTVQSLESQI
jgi:thiol-disulfide isomerase/thioredoxin